ncbi:hypothetical protein TNCV_4043611 [Trichonephila clavipes]|nr:hypothetical protein TNCV_4043611 [Trichonephila clavipes]
MISSFVNDNPETWNQFLREFAYALRTAVHETTGKTPEQSFFGAESLLPVSKTCGGDGWGRICGGTTVDVDKVQIYHQRKSDEVVVDVDSSVSRGSGYQSNNLEESRPRLDRSQGVRIGDSG